MNINDPCHCGSGKKIKDCCKTTLPRISGVSFQINETITLDSVRMYNDGRMVLVSKGREIALSQTATEKSYPREKGPKILTSVPTDPQRPAIDVNTALLQYDRVIAIDTNTKPVGQEAVSVGCILPLRHKENGDSVEIFDRPATVIELYGVTENPEKVVWRWFCDELISAPNERIAIVVDAHLSDLGAFNRRELPVVDNWYLPDRCTLVYGSADKPNDSIANRLMFFCDAHARSLLNHLQAGKPLNAAFIDPKAGSPWVRHRLWNIPA